MTHADWIPTRQFARAATRRQWWWVRGLAVVLVCGTATAVAQEGMVLEEAPEPRAADGDKPKIKLRRDSNGMWTIEGAPGDVSTFDFWYRNIIEDLSKKSTAQKDIRVFKLVNVDVTFAASLLTEMFNEQTRQQAAASRNRNANANARGRQQNQRGRQPEPEEPEEDRSGADPLGMMGSMFGQSGDLTEALTALSDSSSIRVVPNKQQNTLIIRARSEDFPDIIKLLNKIDRPGGNVRDYEIVTLENIAADEAKNMVEELLGLNSNSGAANAANAAAARRAAMQAQRNNARNRGNNQQAQAQAQQLAQQMADEEIRLGSGAAFDKSDIRISSMPATNSVVVMGPEEARTQIVEIIRQLDTYGEDSMVATFHLEKADAESLASSLSEAYGGGSGRGEDKTVSIVANTNTNTLYVVAPPHLRTELTTAIADAELKADQLVTPKVITVTAGDADAIATKLNEVFETRGTRGGKSKIVITGDKATNQLFVIAPNDIFKQIQELATSMDRPDSDQVTSRHYVLKHASSTDIKDRIVEMVTMLARSVNVASGGRGGGTDLDMGAFAVMDEPRTNSLIVMGAPKTFIFVEQALQALDVEAEGDSRRITKVFQLANADARQVAENINRLYGATRTPGIEPARAEANEAINAVVVHGSAREVEAIERDLIKPFEEATPPQETRLTEVFHLEFGDPATVARAINDSMGPQGQRVAEKDRVNAVAESGTQSVVVTANASQMERIRVLITDLDSGNFGRKVREIVPLQHALSSDLAEVLRRDIQDTRRSNQRGQLPISVVADENTNVLIVSGSAKEVEDIKATIVALDQPPLADSGRYVKVYSLKYANLWSVNNAINEAFNRGRGQKESDRVNSALDWDTGTLIVTASKEKHGEIETMLADIDTASDSVRSFKIIKMESGDAAEVAATLQQLIDSQRSQRGQAKPSVTADASTNSLIVYASEAEMVQFKPLIDSMNAEGNTGNSPQRIPLKFANAATTADLLTQIFGEGNTRGRGRGGRGGGERTTPVIISDDTTNTLIVRAQEKDFLEIQAMVAELDVEDQNSSQVHVLQVAQGVNVEELARTVEDIIRRAEDDKKQRNSNYRPQYVSIGSDARSGAMLVTGGPAQFAEVEALVRTIEGMKPTGPNNVRIIDLGNVSSEEVKNVLDQLIEGRQSSGARPAGRTTPTRTTRGGRR